MNSINLPCGCQITETSVLGMCPEHAYEMRQKNITRQRAYDEYVRMMQAAEAKPVARYSFKAFPPRE